jgi:peptidoglycan/xylan/chitin deacetylase (PgdA/CDA1 family)
MRTGLTQQQTNIINATVKRVYWLFEIDRNNDGTPDYYWSTQGREWNGHTYTPKVMSFTPLTLTGGCPELGIIAPANITIQASFAGSNISGVYASDFEGASITVHLVGSTTADGEAELMSWRFIVVTATSVDQILTLDCQDWFTLKLEGDYPNTPLVSELFPASIMKDDNVCVPVVFGTPFFPIRWITKTWTAYPGGPDYFTLSALDGDQTALFAAGQFVLVDCGSDGLKSCWVDHSSYAGSPSYTTVYLTSASAPLTANTNKAQTDHYVLGPSAPAYTIDRARTPAQVNFKTTYLASDYTFKQDTLKGSDGVSYKVMQLLCDDANKDGTNDANGFWGVIGKEIYDLPCRFSRSDLAAITNPADIASQVFQDWGIPAGEIDDTSRAAAAAVFTARGLSLNIGLWYRLTREEFISKLLTLSGMIPLYRDKIGFKVLTKVSQMTITEDMVDPGSFKISRTYTKKETDSGYVTWQTDTDPVDQVQKTAVAVKSTMNNRSDTTIEAEWILDSVKAQKSGKLALQRILLRDKTITFTANSRILVLEPGDMITISPQNFGAEGTSYTCQISKMTMREGLWVDVECVRFSDSLEGNKWLYQNQWRKLSCHRDDFVSTGGELWKNQMIAMRVTAASHGGKSISASFDEVRYGEEGLPQCVITFDDGYIDDIGGGKTEYDYMADLGLKATLYVIPSAVGMAGHVSVSQLKNLYTQGWAIANHSNAHDTWANHLITTQAGYESAIKGCYDYLVNNDMPRAARHVAYPGGYVNTQVLAAMTGQGMLTGRTVIGYYQPAPIGNYHLLQERGPATATTLATAIGWIDLAIKQQSTLILGFHDIRDSGGTSNRWSIANYKGLIDYIASHKIECVTIDEWYNRLTLPRYHSLPAARVATGAARDAAGIRPAV